MAERAERLKRTLQSDRGKAVRLLEDWRMQTLKHLRLEAHGVEFRRAD